MGDHDKEEMYDVYHALKLPSVYEELFAITVVDMDIDSHCIYPNDPFKRVLMGHDIEGNSEAQDLTTCLNVILVGT